MTRTQLVHDEFLLREGVSAVPNAGEVGWVKVTEFGRLPRNVWDE